MYVEVTRFTQVEVAPGRSVVMRPTADYVTPADSEAGRRDKAKLVSALGEKHYTRLLNAGVLVEHDG